MIPLEKTGMLRRSQADLPLHTGQAPGWLFGRMVRLAGSVCQLIVIDYGPEELLQRLADPYWFQAFGCVLGFDWHSSGLTTVTCGAVKEAYKKIGPDLGIHVAGGKGGVSRRTPHEIEAVAQARAITEGNRLIYSSKLSAKVDSAAVQDGYQLYHHCFFFDDRGRWAVVQQGMNDANRYARRYHWFADQPIDFVDEPHRGIITDKPAAAVLNMVARESAPARATVVDMLKDHPERLLDQVTPGESLFMPAHHHVALAPQEARQLEKILRAWSETPPVNFEQMLGCPGVGPKTVRSLALIAELVYNTPPSRRDPARYSFAHGGKDGFPFPVDRNLYDRNNALLESVVRRAKIAPAEKDHALKRLQTWLKPA
jgi:uncharacterized protein